MELYARGCFRRWKRPSIFTGSSWPLTLRSPRQKCCCLATRSLTSLDAWGLTWKPTGGLLTLHHRIENRRNWAHSISLAPLLQWARQSYHWYEPTLNSRLRPSIGSTMTSVIIGSIPETGPRFYSKTSMYEQVPTTTLGFTLWVILEQDKWMRMDNACWSSVVTTASVSTTSTSKLSIITECPGYTPDQIIGINSTTSLRGGLSYSVSSLTQPLQFTAVTLTTLWCTAKWNCSQRKPTI